VREKNLGEIENWEGLPAPPFLNVRSRDAQPGSNHKDGGFRIQQAGGGVRMVRILEEGRAVDEGLCQGGDLVFKIRHGNRGRLTTHIQNIPTKTTR